MLANRMLMAASSGAGYVADAAVFDGTNDYLSRGADLTGASDSPYMAFSGWFYFTGGDGSNLSILMMASLEYTIRRLSSNKLQFIRDNTSVSAEIFKVASNTSIVAGAWNHILFNYDGSGGSFNLYINDSDDGATPSIATYGTAKCTPSDWYIGSNAGSEKFPGYMFDFWLAFADLDFSVEANRRKFISASGLPVDLGADGSTPTGSQPIIFQHLADGAAASTFGNNLGYGGGMTITGTLTSTAGPMG
jgi:hypothetical protein